MKNANDWAVHLFLHHGIHGVHIRAIQADVLRWAATAGEAAISAKLSELLIQEQNERNSTKTPVLLGSNSGHAGA